MSVRDVWVVVTCMGRLEFLRRSAPRVLARHDVGYCLVDYSCPDQAGNWLESTYPKATTDGRLAVERTSGRDHFNKCVALNLGARRAIREGARWLCFLDADTLILDGFFDWLDAAAADERFLISDLRADGSDPPSLTGVLVVSSRQFARTSGFDESFQGWGGEDIEFRLRLHALHGLSFGRIPLRFLQAIEHEDALRTRFYQEQDISVSDRKNYLRLIRKWVDWRQQFGCPSAGVHALLFQRARASRQGDTSDGRV